MSIQYRTVTITNRPMNFRYTANQTDRKKTAILRISQSTELLDLHEFADIEVLDTDQIGSEIKTTEFHPTNSRFDS